MDLVREKLKFNSEKEKREAFKVALDDISAALNYIYDQYIVGLIPFAEMRNKIAHLLGLEAINISDFPD